MFKKRSFAFGAFILSTSAAFSQTYGTDWTIGQNFTGTTSSQSGGWFPPDTMGDVGTSNVVQLLNNSFTVYKKDGTLVSRTSMDSFWNAAGAKLGSVNTFDPRIKYDASSGRWFASALDFAGNTHNNILLGVSNDSDPTHGWKAFKFDGSPRTNAFTDFDMLGFNKNTVTVGFNNFGSTTTTTGYLAVSKANLLAGNVSGAAIVDNLSYNNTGFTNHPVTDYSGSSDPMSLSSAYGSSSTDGYVAFTKMGTNTNSYTRVNPWTDNTLATQKGGPKIENGPEFSASPIRVGNVIYGVHSVQGTGSNSALAVYAIDSTTGALIDEHRIDNGNLSLYEPSIAVNIHGDIVVGSSGSSATDYPGSYAIVGKLSGGHLQFGNIQVLKAGSASSNLLDGSRNRFGDYSATSVDPTDPYKFWTFQQVSLNNGESWSTQITEIQINTVPEPASLLALSLGAVALLKRRSNK